VDTPTPPATTSSSARGDGHALDPGGDAVTVTGMDALANGLVTILNGLRALGGGLLTATALMTIVIAVSLAWIALIELDELNRQGTKPEIGRGR